MKKHLFAVTMMILMSLLGCSGENAMESKVSTHTLLSPTEQQLELTLDQEGFINDLRDGGIQIAPIYVDRVVYTSYRVGGINKTPYSQSWSQKIVFSGLPNNDRWGKFYVITKAGDAYLVELDFFKKVTLKDFYSHVDRESSSIEWARRPNDPANIDQMNISLDVAIMKAKIVINWGCDILLGLKESLRFQDGITVVYEETDGDIHVGLITQDTNGNFKAEVDGIPVVKGPYGDYYGVYAKTGKMYVVKLDGTKVPFSFQYNTPENEGEYGNNEYIWGLYSRNSNLYVDQWNPENDFLTIKYEVY